MDRPSRPIVDYLLCGTLIGLGILGLPAVGAYNLLPATVVLDVVFLLSALLMIAWLSPKAIGLVLIVALTLACRFLIVSLDATAPLQDAVQAHKWLFYLGALAFFVGRSAGKPALYVRTVQVLIWLTLAKYLLSIALLGFGSRPGLLTENNYELAMLSALLAVVFTRLSRGRYLYLAALAAIVVLSGSRSASVAFLVVVVYAICVAPPRSMLVRYLALLGLISVSVVPLLVFSARNTILDQLDRVNFLNVFLAETAVWSPLNWLLGTWPLTELSTSACSSLSYYQLLFSENGSCYSVILHAFLLRVVFDFGVVGLVFAFAALFLLMKWARVRTALAIALSGVALANSASVSGLNTVYVVLPIAVAMLLASAPGGFQPPPTSAAAVERADRTPAGRTRVRSLSRGPDDARDGTGQPV